MSMFGRKKGNYLIVCHSYFMSHKDWHTKLLFDVTAKEAKGEAALLAQEKERRATDLSHVDAEAFLLPDVVQVVRECCPPTEETGS